MTIVDELLDWLVVTLATILLAGEFVTPYQAWYAALSLKLSTGTTGSKRLPVIAFRVRF